MRTLGDRLLETIALSYEYTPPQRGNAASTVIAPYVPPVPPSLDRLPAFIIQVNELDKLLATSLSRTLDTDIATNTIDLAAVEDECKAQLSKRTKKPRLNFANNKLVTERDVMQLAIRIISHASEFLGMAYDCVLYNEEQFPFPDQSPYRSLVVDDSVCVIMEDNSWNVFEQSTSEIIELANSDAGRQLKHEVKEEHGRAIMYKLAVAMSDRNTHWALLFGGDGALLFQRCTSEQPQRYGLLCSRILKVETLFVTLLGILLVPGNQPLVDMAKLKIPVPAACSPGDSEETLTRLRGILGYVIEDKDVMPARMQDTTKITGATSLHVWFSMPGHEFMTLQLSRSTTIHSPSSHDLPQEDTLQSLVAAPAVLLVHERMSAGGTGVVFAGTIGALPLIIKTIPPEFQGEADLRHELHVYKVLASLQGRVIPRMHGVFEGEGWVALVIEHCGDKVSDIQQLSVQQRETLLRHVQEIHAHGVRHADLELRNIIMSKSGELRIVDFAFSEVGHQCEGARCWELYDFRRLLELSPGF